MEILRVDNISKSFIISSKQQKSLCLPNRKK